MAHDGAVVQDGLDGQQLLSAGDPVGELGQILHQQNAGTLLGGAGAQQGLAEAAILELVQGQRHGDGDVRRLQLVDAEPVTSAGDGADPGQDEGGDLLGALLVVSQDAGGAEDVALLVGGEVAVAEEGVLQRDLFDGAEHVVGVVDVQGHDSDLLTWCR